MNFEFHHLEFGIDISDIKIAGFNIILTLRAQNFSQKTRRIFYVDSFNEIRYYNKPLSYLLK
jgi:hypothetical protein